MDDILQGMLLGELALTLFCGLLLMADVPDEDGYDSSVFSLVSLISLSSPPILPIKDLASLADNDLLLLVLMSTAPHWLEQ